MSKSTNMLRTRRKDNNVKPNRRLDRKSSRGMIYENEELRLKTININAEIERGQYDIKKLKRENELLKKEIWCLRDEYDKLDKLLKEKEIEFSSSSSTSSSNDSAASGSTNSDTESCNSCSEESDQVETTQNLENMKNLHTEFDHLSIVPEETSENSEKNSNRTSLPSQTIWNYEIKPDQIYDNQQKSNSLPQQQIKHFFSPIKINKNNENESVFFNQHLLSATTASSAQPQTSNFYQNLILLPKNPRREVLPTDNNFNNTENTVIPTLNKSETDLIVKMDNENFKIRNLNQQRPKTINSQSTFSNGGNLEELLNDIETISQDILKITNSQQDNVDESLTTTTKPYKSELNVVLMPNPMPLLGFDKYRNIEQQQFTNFDNNNLRYTKSLDNLLLTTTATTTTPPSSLIEQQNPFYFNQFNNEQYINCPSDYLNYNPFDNQPQQQKQQMGSKTNLLDLTSSEHISSENEENLKFKTTKLEINNQDKQQQQQQQQSEQIKSPKLSIRRKVSIHFKGKKDKLKKQNSESGDSQILTTIAPLTTAAAATTTPQNKQINEKKSIFDIKFTNKHHQKTPSLESKKSTDCEPKTTSSESNKVIINNNNNVINKKLRKSISISPERKKQINLKDESHKKHNKKHLNKKLKNRRSTIISLDKSFLPNRERSFSICTDRSQFADDYLHSEMERTNSLSSCETIKTRKMSNISNIPLHGKVPWCACWGNGCI